MYKIVGILFCLLEGVVVGIYGWTALLWSPLGFLFGLFATSNIILPIILGVPLAISLVRKMQMRPMIFLVLFRTPFIWFISIVVLEFVVRWLYPTALGWIWENAPINISIAFGSTVIFFSPLSKKVRGDFRTDFDKIYGRYYTDYKDYPDSSDYLSAHHDKKQLKRVEAAIKIGSNLYLHTISGATKILDFRLPDSRFRYMIFCTSAMVKACEGLMNDPDLLIKDCLYFLSIYTTNKDNVKEFFSGPMVKQDAETNGSIYFKDFLNRWSTYYETVDKGIKDNATALVSTMIHSTESNEPFEQADQQRLKELSLEIEIFIPSMRRAFIDSIQ